MKMKFHFSHQSQEVKIFFIQKQRINVALELKKFNIRNKSSGAIASFLGQVKVQSKHGKVSSLFIETYKKMTEIQIKKMMNIGFKKFDINDSLIIHRYGKLNVGDDIVLIIVSSQYREQSLKALEFFINWLKVKATFWKKEITDNGSFWVDQNSKDVKLIEKY